MDASVVTMKFSGIRMRIMNFELMKISINIDKFLKRFKDQTNIIFVIYSIIYMVMRKQESSIFSNFIELKKNSLPRNSPHLRA